MITAPQGAERHRLNDWSTQRLLNYLAARRKRRSNLANRLKRCWLDEYKKTEADIKTLEDEIDFIKSILAKREHVE